jgi:hypothetical protein
MSGQYCHPSRGGEGLLEAVKKKGQIFVSPLGYLTEFVKIYNFVGHHVHAL